MRRYSGPDSLTTLLAGILNPSLKMAAGNTATSAANEIFSPVGGGLELNIPAGKTVLLARDATAWSEIGFILPTIGNYRTYFSPNTTGAGNNSNGLLLCGGRPDPSSGVSVGTFGYCELFGYDANQIVQGTSQQSYGSVCIGTASTGASVAQARIWFYGHLNTVGGHYYPCASIAQAGIEIFKSTQDYGVLLRANNVTADRTYDFPDASGTLMISGGSGSVSLSNLTAGTLPVALTLPSALSTTAANREITGQSIGVVINAPSGTSVIGQVNSQTLLTVTSSQTWRIGATSGSGSAVVGTGASGLYLYGGGVNVGYFTDDTAWLVGSYANDKVNFFANSGNLYCSSAATGSVYFRQGTSGLVNAYFSSLVNWNVGDGAGASTSIWVAAQTSALVKNVPSGGGEYLQVASTNTQLNDVNGTRYLTSAGTVSASNRGLYTIAGGLVLNVESTKTIVASVNNVASLTLSNVLMTVPIPIQWSTNVAFTAAQYQIGRNASTTLGINVPTSSTIVHSVNNVTQQTFDVNGVQFNTAAGTVSSGTRGIYQTSTGIIINTPTGTDVRHYVNNAQVSVFAAGGVTLGAPPTFGLNTPAAQIVTVSSAATADMAVNQGSTTQASSGCSVNGSASPYASIFSQTNLIDNATRGRVIAIGHATIPNVSLETAGTNRLTVNVANSRWLTGHNVVFGSTGSALATSATDGFLYLPTCAGTPTGVPTAYTGTCAFIYDTTNNKLYVYNGAWKSTAALA